VKRIKPTKVEPAVQGGTANDPADAIRLIKELHRSQAPLSLDDLHDHLQMSLGGVQMGVPVVTKPKTIREVIEAAEERGSPISDAAREVALQDEVARERRLRVKKRSLGAGRPATKAQYRLHSDRIAKLKGRVWDTQRRIDLRTLRVGSGYVDHALIGRIANELSTSIPKHQLVRAISKRLRAEGWIVPDDSTIRKALKKIGKH
jgi:hypothetical protein